ncbi:MAG: hypothetical protein II866_08665 [Prevotella sp.]|nr:hypothetical protein [Prevotella sp.]
MSNPAFMSVSIVGDRHQSRMLSNSASVLATTVTLLAERRSSPSCAADSREVSSQQQGAE